MIYAVRLMTSASLCALVLSLASDVAHGQAVPSVPTSNAPLAPMPAVRQLSWQQFGWTCRRKCVNAGVRWSRESFYLFKDDQFHRFSGDDPDDEYPRPIAGHWPGFPTAWSSGIDAAVDWGKGRVYFFKGGEYLRYDIDADGSFAYGNARPIAGDWAGFPAAWSSGIDAGVNWGNGKVYFFRGNEYLRYDIAAGKVDPGFPSPIAGNWPGFPPAWSAGIDAAFNWGDGTVYFFRGAEYLRYNISGDTFNYGHPRSIAGNWTIFTEPPRADLHETIVSLPVTVSRPDQAARTGDMILTYYRPNGGGPFPAVIYSHGRRSTHRGWPARKRELDVATFWVQRGFAFFIATRLGYGATGLAPDMEHVGGECATARYGPAAGVVVTQAVAAATYAKTLPFVDESRIILAGNSTGGLAMIAASATPLPDGVRAALNFAGGGGGGVLGPARPCNEPDLRRLAAESGRSARLPMLWLYARNDTFWGAQLPVQWHAAYASGGGQAEFQMLPPVGSDGHDLIDHIEAWAPLAIGYLAKLGIRPRPIQR